LAAAPVRILRKALRQLIGIEDLMVLRRRLPVCGSLAAFASAALRDLNVQIGLGSGSLESIPDSGPVIFTCNHPYGGLDGLAAIAVLGAARADLRVLANADLGVVPEIAAALIPVDLRSTRSARQANARSLRAALRWLRAGGALLIFPAGEVSRLRLRTLRACDPPWPETVGSLIRLSRASVLPLHVEGHNSAFFLVTSLLCKPLGELLLARELLNKRDARLTMHLGTLCPPARLARFASDAGLINYLRLKSDLLPRMAVAAVAAPQPVQHTTSNPRSTPAILHRELQQLPDEALLLESGAFRVYTLRAAGAPALMQEIGRQRELSFRAVGEGTGADVDCDLYDNIYDQLLLWDQERGAIAGGYRLCRIDEVRRRYGRLGLYTQALFDYREPFFSLLGPALELGRSFVGLEYQRSYTPLLLLWRAICEYVGRHPRYCRLLGPVSISNAYQSASREVIVDYLEAACVDPMLAGFVRARTPFRRRHNLQPLDQEALRALDLDGISSLLAEHEPDAKGLPVLLRQYLKMGGRILGFNVDAAFSNALDCLLLVDLRRTDPRLLQRYLSDEARTRIGAVQPPPRLPWQLLRPPSGRARKVPLRDAEA
jgi:putative hemolysin